MCILFAQSILCLVFSVICLMFIHLVSNKVSNHKSNFVPESVQVSNNISVLFFAMVFCAIIASLSTKVNYTFFYVHFILLFESILVLENPLKLSLMGINKFVDKNPQKPSVYQIYTAKYARLLLITILIMLCIVFDFPDEAHDSLSSLSNLLLTPLCYIVIFNAFCYKLSKFILSNQKDREAFIEKNLSFSSEGTPAVIITAIITVICLYWFYCM